MSVINFSFTPFADGNTLTGADLNNALSSIKAVFDQVIADNNSTPLLPVTFTGVNRIAAVLNNSLIGIDTNGNVTLTPRATFDNAVTTAVNAATAASASAADAAASYNAALSLGSVLPVQAGKAGLEITTDGNATAWALSVPGALSILNSLRYFG